MRIAPHLPDRLRSRYAFKLLGISLLIVVVIVASGTVMALQLSERVTDEQLQSVEANAELEADALARWLEGQQESIRLLSAHEGLDAADAAASREVLQSERETLPDETESLHLVERADEQPSNGTTEEIVASTDSDLEGRELAATNIDWGETTDGDEMQFAFEDDNSILVSWVYVDDDSMSVAIASPTADGEHVVIGEYHPSVRIQESTNIIDDTETLVLGGVSAFVMFDETDPDEFYRYKGDRNSTEVGTEILTREDQFAQLSGAELDDTEVRGYHSVPAESVNWVVVKETPRSNALAVTQQVQSDLVVLLGIVIVGFLLIGGVIQYGPIRSIKQLSTQADAIAGGNLDSEIEADNRLDEIGDLKASFKDTKAYIETIASQTEALSNQEFGAPVLDRTIPGPVGNSIATVHEDLQQLITDLETERERYSTLIQQSTDGIIVVRDGIHVFVSDTYVEITGYDRETLVGMPFEQLLIDEDAELARQLCDRDAESSMAYTRLHLVTEQGERRIIEVSSADIDHDDEPAVLVNVQDVTERDRRAKRLEVFNRLLRHNLRHTFQIVLAVLNHVDNEDVSESVPLSQARQQSEELVETAGTARRMDNAFENLDIRSHDLGVLLSELEQRLATEFPTATIRSVSGTATVEAAHMLDDALWELLENACEHGGETPQIDLELTVEESVATLTISDNGPGIPPAERKTLQAGEETDLQHTSGLGLWFAYWTIQASSGTLAFDVSEGTTVIVRLPLAEEPAADALDAANTANEA